MSKEYLGIDIGGTKCAVVRANETGEILEKVKFDTKDVNTTISRILEEASKITNSNVVSCGISCGGPLDADKGIILSPPNLPDWDRIEIARLVSEKINIKTKLCNDADACALAEWMFGAGKGTKNMVFLTFGTGMGAGLVLNGKLYSGTNGNAGEVGHIRLKNDGPIGYRKAGSFEGFCSGGGIKQLGIIEGRKAIQKGIVPTYWNKNEDMISAKDIAIAAKNGDKIAQKVYKISGKHLGKALSVIIDILNPEKIVIGSIYQRAQELMNKEMIKELKKETLDSSYKVVEVVPAALGDEIGDVAAISIAKMIEEQQ